MRASLSAQAMCLTSKDIASRNGCRKIRNRGTQADRHKVEKATPKEGSLVMCRSICCLEPPSWPRKAGSRTPQALPESFFCLIIGRLTWSPELQVSRPECKAAAPPSMGPAGFGSLASQYLVSGRDNTSPRASPGSCRSTSRLVRYRTTGPPFSSSQSVRRSVSKLNCSSDLANGVVVTELPRHPRCDSMPNVMRQPRGPMGRLDAVARDAVAWSRWGSDSYIQSPSYVIQSYRDIISVRPSVSVTSRRNTGSGCRNFTM